VWPGVLERIHEAARRGAQLVVLPEGTFPSYVLGRERFDSSETHEAVEQCRAVCRVSGIVLVLGAARRVTDRVFNSAIVIDRDGSIAGTYDKHFLWDFDRHWFTPGEELHPIRTSLGALGVMICADGRIPTIARALVERGAQLLIMPTAWVTSGRDPQALENIQADLLARVRARENDAAFVAANKCGVELGCVAYCGKSQIIARDGAVLAMGSQHEPELILADLELETPAPRRSPSACDERRHAKIATPLRIAIGSIPRRRWSAEQERVVEADAWIDPAGCSENLRENVLRASDDEVLDPGYLAECRLAGLELAVWKTASDPEWQVAFARARALELRLYLTVFDTLRNRAYAIDPDGAVLCGTFDRFRIARFQFAPGRTMETMVAPGTDVLAGLQHARAVAAR